MCAPNPTPSNRDDDRYHGFSLTSVCWGYRDLFERTIEDLLDSGAIGPERQAVTRTFFELLKHADQSCYDHVLRRFLGAINPRTEWLLGVPAIFADVVELGRDYAADMPHHGVMFFEILGAGGMGDSPAEVRTCLSEARRLRSVDVDLSLSFLKGYRRLISRLDAREIALYIEAGLTTFHRQPRAGLAFMEGAVESAETTVQTLARECRLHDVEPQLNALLGALSGRQLAVRPLCDLDTAAVAVRGSRCVCLGSCLYLPDRVRTEDSRRGNHGWYTLTATVTSALLTANSFCVVHGDAAYPTCMDIVGARPAAVNLYLFAEWWRALGLCRQMWPGSCRLLDRVVRDDYGAATASSHADTWARAVLLANPDALPLPLMQYLRSASKSTDLFQTAAMVTPGLTQALVAACPELDIGIVRPPGFLPDFVFSGVSDQPPRGPCMAGLKAPATCSKTADSGAGEEDTHGVSSGTAAGAADDPPEDDGSASACHVYDEWSRDEDDYLRRYCHVHELWGEPSPLPTPPDSAAEGRRLRRIFERLKPTAVRKEKLLQDGDSISEDRLLDYLVRRRDDPSPRIDFYERPRVVHRDLAVLVVLDVSGSTADSASDTETVIDIERRAAILLGHGLTTLGDRFAICGFNSNGRENCRFFVYKDFADAWGKASSARIMGATPAHSTRMGPALRHAGWRLGQVEARQRLILVITDGRPMDTGYDSSTHYAQHDVRRACEENRRDHIHTFAIATRESRVADMEIMFSRGGFAILSDIRCLPRVLPLLYTRLTF